MSVARYFNPKLRPGLLIGEYPDWLRRHPRKSYIIAAIISAPDWVDRAALNSLHKQAKQKTLDTGIEHVMDHIIPLNHSDVCGLTVPWNFQLITRVQNAAKGNKTWPDSWHESLPLFEGDLR